MFKWIKKILLKGRVVEPKQPHRHYRTDQEIEDEQAEIEEMLILSDPSWFGDVARKHHG